MPRGGRFTRAREVFETYPTAREDITAEPSDAPPLNYLAALLDSPTPENAVTFCAYLLGRREAVWWGHQCLHAVPDCVGRDDHDLLLLAEAWVREPEEDRRSAAMAGGMGAPVKTPAAWVALAAGWSGGSMMAAGATPVPPPPHLTAKAVNAAVLGALARVPGARRAETLRSFVDMGVQLFEQQAAADA